MSFYIVDLHNKKYYGPYDINTSMYRFDLFLIKEIAFYSEYEFEIITLHESEMKEEYKEFKLLEPLSKETEITIKSKSQAKRIKTMIEK